MRFRIGTRLAPSPSAVSSIGVDAAIEGFLASHRRRGIGTRYLEELRSYLIGAGKRTWKPLAPWCQANGIDSVADLDRGALDAYLDAARAASSAGTYRAVCVVLGLFLKHLVDEEHISAMAVTISKPKRLESAINVFTHDEIVRIHAVVKSENVRDQAIFMLLVDTGLRAGEVCSLRLSDLHVERREIVVRAEISKNGRSRILPLGASLTPIRRYLKLRGESTTQAAALFLSFYSTPTFAGGPKRAGRRPAKALSLSSSPLTRTGMYQLVRTWGRLANITEARCSPHTFRHYFAISYLRRGGNILVLQKILGHARLAVTERYLQSVSAVDLKASHDRFSPAAELASPRSEPLSRS